MPPEEIARLGEVRIVRAGRSRHSCKPAIDDAILPRQTTERSSYANVLREMTGNSVAGVARLVKLS